MALTQMLVKLASLTIGVKISANPEGFMPTEGYGTMMAMLSVIIAEVMSNVRNVGSVLGPKAMLKSALC